ncbi:MAG: glycerol kinase, partial [SAR202 cluster bacterium]|nr:glycerol kinase [SAR202 cluster bacterium]
MKNKKKYVISIDQGSTSTRCVIYDDELNSIASSQYKLDEIYPKEGWVELDPNQIIESVLYTIKDVVSKSEIDKEKIISIGITNQRETIVFWDKLNLKPITNAISWQCLRGKEICDKLKGSKFEELLVDSTGLKLDPYFSFSKIVWAIENNKTIYKLLAQNKLNFGTIDSWLLANIIEGSPHKIEVTNASRTGLYNTKLEDWDAELLSILGINRSFLPKIFSSNET